MNKTDRSLLDLGIIYSCKKEMCDWEFFIFDKVSDFLMFLDRDPFSNTAMCYLHDVCGFILGLLYGHVIDYAVYRILYYYIIDSYFNALPVLDGSPF